MKFFLRGILTAFLLLNISCLDDGTNCGSFSTQYIDIRGITGDNVAIGNSFSDFALLGAGTSVAYNEYGIRAVPDAAYGEELTIQGGFRAYACSPRPPQPTEEIAEIAVFGSADYKQATSSKVFVAGDTLNAIIKIYEPYSGRIVGLPDFFIDDDVVASDEPFTLQFTSAPAQATEQQFTVHYRLENGEFYQFTTELVTIRP